MKFTALYNEIEKHGIPITSRNFRVLIENYKLKQKLINLQK